MADFYTDCTINKTTDGISADAFLVNNTYQAPTRNPPQLQILAEANSQWLHHEIHYVPGSLRIIDKARFEATTCQLTLEDAARGGSNLPILGGPRPRQRLMILNTNATTLFFKGYVVSPRPRPFLQREDFTEYRYLGLSCNDETELFKRIPIKEVIEDTTEFGMVADLIGRYCPELDISGIDTSLGAYIEKKTIDNPNPGQRLTETSEDACF